MDDKKKINYWTIGTGLDNYFDAIISWLKFENLDLMKFKETKIIYELQENDNDDNNRVRCYFENYENIPFYKCNKSYGKSTIDQFLHFLTFFEVIEEYSYSIAPYYYKINKNFIDKFCSYFYEKKLEGIEKELSLYLMEILKNKLTKHNEKLQNLINEENDEIEENVYINTYSHRILNSFVVDYLRKKEILTNKSFEYKDIIKKIKKICEIKNDDYYFYNILKKFKDILKNSNEFSKLNEIFEFIDNELFKTLIKYLKWPFYDNSKILFLKIDDNNTNNYEEYCLSKIQDKNNISNDNNCLLINIYDLLLNSDKLSSKQKINIPIYQRNYVWNNITVSNMINSILDDVRNNKANNTKYSFLNNIIYTVDRTYKQNNYYTTLNIIDGQQRIFTLWLIIFSLSKLLIEDKTNCVELNKIFESSKKFNEIFFNENADELESYKNFYEIIDWKDNIEFEGNKISELLTEICKLIRDFSNDEKINFKKILEHILFNTYVVQTILNDFEGHKIFQNLNKNVKILNSLDLLKNQIYTYIYNDKNNNIDRNEEINKYIRITKPFYKENGDLNAKYIENFASLLFFREKTERFPNLKRNDYDLNMFVFEELKACFDKWINDEKNNSPKESTIKYALRKFEENINKYFLIKNPYSDCKPNFFPMKVYCVQYMVLQIREI
ncbi:DUF262 domain-containing protein [Mycoplasma elephantis]|uniref:DUF262 domain-containing protein n=1 Tax=Mycoplasma elephantis TaxID=114882 RepID=UPI00048719C0|nr:DUF262 domain-containing protein [Mycoplasma elephantis]